MRKPVLAAAATGLAALMFAATASAHARLSPAVSLASELQLYSLAVPTEKANATTTQIVLDRPERLLDRLVRAESRLEAGRAADRFGDSAVIQKVTWTGGDVPTEEDSLFQFLAQPAKGGTYTFQVQQTYSDGSIVDWSGSESSAAPAPTIKVVSAIGGGGTSTLTIAALVLGTLGLIVGAIALFSRGGRSLT